MIGMDRNTGKRISGAAHLRQSLGDLFSTAKTERVMRPGYGSGVPALVDSPITPETTAELAQDIVAAVGDWEPRCILRKCTPSKTKNSENSFAAGKIWVDLELTVK